MKNQKNIRYFKWLLFAVSAITVSCEKADPQDNHTGLIPDMAKQIESIITSKHHGRVFAPDLSAYNHIATTKAKPQQQYTTTDLLWDKAIFLSVWARLELVKFIDTNFNPNRFYTQQQTDEISDLVLQLENVCLQACEELEVEYNTIKNTNKWKLK